MAERVRVLADKGERRVTILFRIRVDADTLMLLFFLINKIAPSLFSAHRGHLR